MTNDQLWAVVITGKQSGPVQGRNVTSNVHRCYISTSMTASSERSTLISEHLSKQATHVQALASFQYMLKDNSSFY